MGDQDRKSYRGYGLAAVAGLGIGAALYYFLNNRQQEQPHANSHGDDETQRQNSLRTNSGADAEKQRRSSSAERKRNEFRSRSWTLEQCTICFENMLIDSANPTLKLRCGHTFHLACASPWLEKQNTCPNCRKDINA